MLNKINFRTGMFALMVLIPVFLYLLLFGFGKNKYDLRRWHPIDVVNNADGVDTVYYQLPLALVISSDVISKADDKYMVSTFISANSDSRVYNQLNRLYEAYINEPNFLLVTHMIGEDDLPQKASFFKEDNNGSWLLAQNKADVFDKWTQYFKLHESVPTTESLYDYAVLSDKVGVIRGYYKIKEKDEVDRLLLELKVLLTNE